MPIDAVVGVDPAWLSKEQAATKIGVTEKTLSNLVRGGRIQQAEGRNSAGRTCAAFSAEEIAAFADERNRAPIQRSRYTAAPADANGNGHAPSTALALKPKIDLETLIRTLAGNLPGKLPEKVFLTIPEAAQLTGLSQALIRRWCQKKKLKAIMDGGWKIPRRALLAL